MYLLYNILKLVLLPFSYLLKCFSILSIPIRERLPLMRGILYRYKFNMVADRLSLGSNVDIKCYKNLFCLGSNVAVRSNVILAGAGKLTIGNNTVINEYSIVSCFEEIFIGSNVMIAPRCYILDIDHSYDSKEIPIKDQGYKTSKVYIDDDVWIATQVVITRGVTIGKGSIIAANSVVTRDIPPYSIVGGIPAKVLKQR
ncbi:acyltransferase [Chryseobacterium sp. GCR10]|uniref:Acyltransferase n=1 Tax=Chryseobacterium caseinilyticum TaxID=2771428 RepID=A0ABR8ZHB3_9FLAO|nr:acyltransferase [Chryseobacterium caseinilyticum]MBD8084612.1 acyltransferase [Chryseobacterium caseinilyticum]